MALLRRSSIKKAKSLAMFVVDGVIWGFFGYAIFLALAATFILRKA